MNNAPAPVAAPPLPPATSLAGARKLADGLCAIMTELLKVVESETELVRAGRIAEAVDLDPQKADLSRRYIGAISQFKASHGFMKANTPDILVTLQRQHDAFRAILQVNLTVLATAHAVSEGIIRGVNTEMARRSAPSTYNAYGGHNAPPPRRATPLTVSRVL